MIPTPATTLEGYSYGFLYGVILALLIYNLVLCVRLQSSRYFFYSAYLAAFVIMNLAYTGHGYSWLWPELPTLQRWSNPVLILAFAILGLLFATRFLNFRDSHPQFERWIRYVFCWFIILMVLAVILQEQISALVLAFVFVVIFAIGMIALGLLSVRSGNRIAKYFLCATLIGAISTALTGLTVWNLLPYHPMAYLAIEVGMMLEAVLLALALADQFRQLQRDRNSAMRQARLDPLTGVNNRRAFYELSAASWNAAVRNHRDTAVVLLDIDHFKVLNDKYGHAAGDEALVEIAKVLRANSRGGDILARWGGEEFILLLPETSRNQAVSIANRHRRAIARIQISNGYDPISFTASFGVALKQAKETSLDALIEAADKQLYNAKLKGRNIVCHNLRTVLE